jgi:hypothetical protein
MVFPLLRGEVPRVATVPRERKIATPILTLSEALFSARLLVMKLRNKHPELKNWRRRTSKQFRDDVDGLTATERAAYGYEERAPTLLDR